MVTCVTTLPTVHITIRDSRDGGGTALVMTLLLYDIIIVYTGVPRGDFGCSNPPSKNKNYTIYII